MIKVCLFIAALLGSVFASDDQLLSPVQTSGPELALIIFQGASIGTDQYIKLGSAIQNTLKNVKLWVSIPSAILDTANPGTIALDAARAKKSLASAGYNGTNYIVAGHSLGGVSVQMYSESHQEGILGQILVGSALMRKYRGKNYPIPTLVAAGELDGLFRVTRVAEEFYNSISLSANPSNAMLQFPVVVIQGMNHMQWASGTPPALVKASDLKAELAEEDARAQGAQVIADFISSIVLNDVTSTQRLKSAVLSTQDFIKPIVKAYEFEGSRQFNAPQQIGGPSETCTKGLCPGVGSAWALYAQEYMANSALYKTNGLTLNVTNQFVSLSSMPPLGAYHLPDVTVNADNAKVRDLPTYSQCFWETLDGFDTGFVATSAIEIATKMLSRQCSYIRGLGYDKTDAPFTLDDPDICADLNQQSYEWALQNAAKTSRERFNSKGQKLVFGADEAKIGGPFWIDARLSFKDKTVDGAVAKEVSAPMIKTSYDFPKIPLLPDPSCYHYCKLLSPARAMEWIYVDGLRLNAGITSTA